MLPQLVQQASAPPACLQYCHAALKMGCHHDWLGSRPSREEVMTHLKEELRSETFFQMQSCKAEDTDHGSEQLADIAALPMPSSNSTDSNAGASSDSRNGTSSPQDRSHSRFSTSSTLSGKLRHKSAMNVVGHVIFCWKSIPINLQVIRLAVSMLFEATLKDKLVKAEGVALRLRLSFLHLCSQSTNGKQILLCWSCMPLLFS